jgi:FAD/FMN-containing dehydrogenase
MPHNATEVSMGLVALLQGTDNVHRGAGDWHIAVRGGGHTLGHTNNIEDGVTIDLFYLNETTYDPATNLASVMPGSLWREVYPVLHTYGVVVAGGRDGGVGVPGILLGGGSNYYMGEHGFGCDTVRNYEVVLADGSIVNANEDEHRDLWRALKGGGINFGIVTRFDMEAIPDIPLSYGMRTMPGNASGQFVDAVVDYTDIQQQAFPKDALIALIFSLPGVEVLATAEINTAGVLNSPGFDHFARIPQLTPFTPVVTNLYALAAVTSLPGGSWYV